MAAAREHAVRNARFTMAETLKEQAKLVRRHPIQIKDEAGNVLDTIFFGDVVVVED